MTSLWSATATERIPTAPLDGDLDVDVAIVGGGYSGLWTAHYLAERSPGMSIAIIERDVVGFGASGRNGGWCTGEIAASFDKLVTLGGRGGAVALLRAINDAVDEVGRFAQQPGVDCGYAKGGALWVARNRPQLRRLQSHLDEYRALGFGDDDARMLTADQARAMLDGTDVIGGAYLAPCAAVHPLKLVHALADAVVDNGVSLYEATPATSVEPKLVRTEHGRVRASHVVLATEGYTSDLARYHRRLIPLYSLMLATEPLDQDVWAQIGLAQRQTFADARHAVIYGQRTADNRIAFGGRGAWYPYASRINPAIEQRSGTHDAIAATLRRLLPAIGEVRIDYTWGGVLGVPRDWTPAVTFDRTSGFGTIGGYVGEGVAASNLAARTLADMIVGDDTERTHLPWVGHVQRAWEPEPLRWMGVNAGLLAMRVGDRIESRSGKPSRLASTAKRLIS